MDVELIVEPILDDELNYPEWDDELGAPLQLDDVEIDGNAVKLLLIANGWAPDSPELLEVAEKAKAALVARYPDAEVSYEIDER